MDKEALIAQTRKRYTLAAGTLDERGRRTLAAAEALAVGWGGITLVARATGLSRATIGLGVKELRGTVAVAAPGRVRRPGGGRKKTVAKDPSVLADLERLVEPTARGDPQSPLRWTSKARGAYSRAQRNMAVSREDDLLLSVRSKLALVR